MLNPNPSQQSGVLASLSPETLDKLADLVVAKLVAKNDRSCFPSKVPDLKARRFSFRYRTSLTKQALPFSFDCGITFGAPVLESFHFSASLPDSCSLSIFSTIASSSHCPKVLLTVMAATLALRRMLSLILILCATLGSSIAHMVTKVTPNVNREGPKRQKKASIVDAGLSFHLARTQ